MNNKEPSLLKIEGDNEKVCFYYDKIVNLIFFNEKRYIKIIKNLIDDYNDSLFCKADLNKYYEIYTNTPNIIKLVAVGGFGQVYQLNKDTAIKLCYSDLKNYSEFEIPQEIVNIDSSLENNILLPTSILKECKFTGFLNIFQIHIVIIYIIYCIIESKKFNCNIMYLKLKNYDIVNEYKTIFSNKNNNQRASELFFYFFFKYLKKGEQIFIIDEMLNLCKFLKRNQTTNGYILFSPLAEEISTYIFLNPSSLALDKSGIKAPEVFFNYYRVFILQVFLTLLKINFYIKFAHNDLKPDNILVYEVHNEYIISYQNLDYFFDLKYIFKISDFDLSSIDKKKNIKLKHTKFESNKSWFTDIHFFIHKLFLYISKREVELDLDFFLFLHETFILPYCKISFDDMKKDRIVKENKNIICCNGLYYKSDFPISILEKFIQSEFFDEWKSK